jgi:rhamnogalacturonyl hydrolase YesR
MRNDSLAYWNDGVYMAPPFLAMYGAVNNKIDLLQLAYDNCRLYREALLITNGTTGPLWAHAYMEDEEAWLDKGLWATGKFGSLFLRYRK